MIVNRNIVVKRYGNSLILPSTKEIVLEVEKDTFLPVKQFLMCRVVGYNPNTGKLDLKINSDIVTEDKFWISVEANSDILSSLKFNSLEIVKQPTRIVDYTQNKYPKKQIDNWELNYLESDRKEIQKANISLQLSVKDLMFSNGKVSFEHYITQVRRISSFDMHHLFLKTEHDSIKNYFPKILNIN